MQDEQDRIDPKDMTPEQAHAEALRRIEAAAESGQDWLDLGDLPLDAIPLEIAQLAGQLTELSMGNYQVEEVRKKTRRKNWPWWHGDWADRQNPKTLIDLTALTTLKQLRSLDLSACRKINDFSPIESLQSLKFLNLNWCNIADLIPLKDLASLKSLQLRACYKIKDIAPLQKLTNLESLNLCKGRGLENIEPLQELRSLRNLELRECTKVSNITSLQGLVALESLDLSFCRKITDIKVILTLSNLRRLDICGPAGTSGLCGAELARKLPNLEVLRCRQLSETPCEVLSQDRYWPENCLPLLRAWLTDLEQGEADTHELKLFILGNGRVGKSELFRRLRGDAFHGDLPSTHGIQLGRFELCRHHDNRPIFLNAWDFGGQDVYLGTHALFLKSRAIFVLAWHPNMETDAPYTEAVSGLEMRHRPLQYWLDYIRSLAGDEARVIVVQTQCARESDEASPPLRDTARLAWYRPTISCASQDGGVDSLRDLLKRAARHRLETPAPPRLPASWLAVRDRLVALRATEKTIDRSRFDAICAETHHGASSEALLHYLHQAGDVFHQSGLFGNSIVLDQQWALDGIYTLFDRGRVLPLLRGHHGVFSPEMLDALTWNGRYSDKEQALLLSMMESCDLIFPIDQWGNLLPLMESWDLIFPNDQWRKTRYYAMIDALPDAAASANRIAMVWPDDAQAVEAVAEYAFLHDGVLRALLANIGRLAGRDAVYWRDGVCLYDAGTVSRARIDTEQRADGSGHVRMRATGPDADALCARLITLLKTNRIGAPPKITRNDASERPALPHPPSERDLDMLQPGPIPPLPGQKPVVYFSYAWGGDDRKDLKAFAVQLHHALEDEFDVRRDEEATRPGDRISEFMREVARGTRVLVLLSDKYVRSANCMQELSYLYDRHRADPRGLDDHVLPLMIDRGFRCGTEQRLGYVRYWKDELARLKQLTVGLEPHECLSAFEEMQAINRFVGMTDQVLKFMGDVLMPRGDDLPSEDFAAVKAALRRLGGE